VISIDEFVRQYIVPRVASVVDHDVLDIGTDFGTSSWRTPEASPPLLSRSPDTLARDLRALWSDRPEMIDLVDPLVALCGALGLGGGDAHAADEMDGGQYTLF
jgi:hypothetical protein